MLTYKRIGCEKPNGSFRKFTCLSSDGGKTSVVIPEKALTYNGMPDLTKIAEEVAAGKRFKQLDDAWEWVTTYKPWTRVI